MSLTHRFAFSIEGAAFLWRARKALEAFDEREEPEDLLVAAMQLRLGIEARLFEYLDVALTLLGRPRTKLSQYRAQDLLRRLAAVDPESIHEGGVVVVVEQTGESASFEFTPVTRELANVHARLGTFLHFPYFWNEPSWYLRQRFEGSRGWPTLYHVRDFLEDGVRQLDRACSGTLLAHPAFTSAVEGMMVGYESD